MPNGQDPFADIFRRDPFADIFRREPRGVERDGIIPENAPDTADADGFQDPVRRAEAETASRRAAVREETFLRAGISPDDPTLQAPDRFNTRRRFFILARACQARGGQLATDGRCMDPTTGEQLTTINVVEPEEAVRDPSKRPTDREGREILPSGDVMDITPPETPFEVTQDEEGRLAPVDPNAGAEIPAAWTPAPGIPAPQGLPRPQLRAAEDPDLSPLDKVKEVFRELPTLERFFTRALQSARMPMIGVLLDQIAVPTSEGIKPSTVLRPVEEKVNQVREILRIPAQEMLSEEDIALMMWELDQIELEGASEVVGTLVGGLGAVIAEIAVTKGVIGSASSRLPVGRLRSGGQAISSWSHPTRTRGALVGTAEALPTDVGFYLRNREMMEEEIAPGITGKQLAIAAPLIGGLAGAFFPGRGAWERNVALKRMRELKEDADMLTYRMRQAGLEADPNAEVPERAAIILSDGTRLTGRNHMEITQEYIASGRSADDLAGAQEGFVTNRDNFWSRLEVEDMFGGRSAENLRLSEDPVTPNVIPRIRRTHEEFDGSTINPITGEDFAGKDFYSVGIVKGREFESRIPFNESEIEVYIRNHMDLLGEPGNVLGTWFDKGKGRHVMDIARTLQNLDEAVALGRAHDQDAIFDLLNFQSIWLKDAAGNVLDTPVVGGAQPGLKKIPPDILGRLSDAGGAVTEPLLRQITASSLTGLAGAGLNAKEAAEDEKLRALITGGALGAVLGAGGMTVFNRYLGRLADQGVSLWDAKLPGPGRLVPGAPRGGTSLRRELTSAGDMPRETFERFLETSSWARAQIQEAEFVVREIDRLIDEGIDAGRLVNREQSWVMINTALSARGRAALEALPEELRDAVSTARSHLDALSQRFIDEGLVEGPLVQTFIQNKGIYLHRAYRVWSDPDWAAKVDKGTRNRAKAWLRSQEPYKDLGEDQMDVLIERLLYKGIGDSSPIVRNAGKVGEKDLQMLRSRFLESAPMREFLGEIEGGGENYLRSVGMMASTVGNHQFLKDARVQGLSRGFFSPAEDFATGHTVQIAKPTEHPMSPLNGLYTTPEIKLAFEEAFEVASQWPAAYMKLVGTAKLAKTVGSPQTHVRNFTSASLFGLANGHLFNRNVFPNLHQAWKASNKELIEARRARGLAGLPSDIPSDQVVEMAVDGLLDLSDAGEMQRLLLRLQELGVTFQSARGQELRHIMVDMFQNAGDDPSQIDKFVFSDSRMAKVMRRGAKSIGEFYQWEDDFWKVAGFLSEFQMYRNALPDVPVAQIEARAASHIRDHYPTYSLVPRLAKELRQFPLMGPFTAFSAEIIRTGSNLLRTTARELADPNPAIRGIGARRAVGILSAASVPSAAAMGVSHLMGVDRDTDLAFRELLPWWSENSDIFWIQDERDSEEPGMRYIDISYSDPYNLFKRPIHALLRGESWEESLVDALKEVGRPFYQEDIATQHLFNLIRNQTQDGRQVYNPEAPGLHKVLEMGRHLLEAVTPGAVDQAIRIGQGYGLIPEKRGRELHGHTELAAVILGLRTSKLDANKAAFFRSRDFNERLREANRNLTRVVFSRGEGVSEGDIRRAYERSETARQELYEEMGRVTHALRVMGLTDSQILRQYMDGGMSRRNALDLMRGRYHPYDLFRTFRGTDTPNERDRNLLLRDLWYEHRGMEPRGGMGDDPFADIFRRDTEEER